MAYAYAHIAERILVEHIKRLFNISQYRPGLEGERDPGFLADRLTQSLKKLLRLLDHPLVGTRPQRNLKHRQGIVPIPLLQ